MLRNHWYVLGKIKWMHALCVSALMLSTGWLLFYLYRALNTSMKLFYHVLVSVHVSFRSRLPLYLRLSTIPPPSRSFLSFSLSLFRFTKSPNTTDSIHHPFKCSIYVHKHMVFVISLMCVCVKYDSVCMRCVDDATVSGYSNNGNWTMKLKTILFMRITPTFVFGLCLISLFSILFLPFSFSLAITIISFLCGLANVVGIASHHGIANLMK